jgi:hypothetical protein
MGARQDGSAARFWNLRLGGGRREIFVADTWNETIRKVTRRESSRPLLGWRTTLAARTARKRRRFDHPQVAGVGQRLCGRFKQSHHSQRNGGIETPALLLTLSQRTRRLRRLFTVVAAGSPPLHYQWRFNGQNILGATTSELNLANIQKQNQGSYTVAVSNAGGSTTSKSAELTVIAPNTPPTISTISDQVTSRNTPTPQIHFIVTDAETGGKPLDLDHVFQRNPRAERKYLLGEPERSAH